MNYEITFTLIITILVIILIISVTIMSVFTTNPGSEERKIRMKKKLCHENNECESKMCQNNICKVKINEECDKNDLCENFSKCINGKCISIHNEKNNYENINKNMEDQKKTNEYLQKYEFFKELYISKSLNEEPIKFMVHDMIDAFFYNNKIFIIFCKDNTKIISYNLNGKCESEYSCNIKIISNIEIIGNNLYTVSKGILFKCKLNENNNFLIFENQNEYVEKISSNAYNTKLYKKKAYDDPYVLLGNEEDYVIIDHENVFYKSIDNKIQKIEHNSNHVFYYEKKLYLNNHRIKGFHSFSIFLHMK